MGCFESIFDLLLVSWYSCCTLSFSDCSFSILGLRSVFVLMEQDFGSLGSLALISGKLPLIANVASFPYEQRYDSSVH